MSKLFFLSEMLDSEESVTFKNNSVHVYVGIQRDQNHLRSRRPVCELFFPYGKVAVVLEHVVGRDRTDQRGAWHTRGSERNLLRIDVHAGQEKKTT